MTGAAPVFRRIATGFDLITAGVWDTRNQTLVVADAAGGGVWAVRPDKAADIVIAHRRGVGGFAEHADGGYVVSGRNVAVKHGDRTTVLLELDAALGLTRFNDLTTDHTGRVYVGSVDFDPTDRDLAPRPGFLHLIELDGSSRIVDDGIGTANGLVVSPAGDRLYFADTWAKTVWVYDMDAHGSLSGRTAFYFRRDGELDGLAIDTVGNVWAAVGEPEDRLVVIDPGGGVVTEIEVPAQHVTTVLFGAAGEVFVAGANDVFQADVARIAPGVLGTIRPPARVAIRHGASPAVATHRPGSSRGITSDG